ncbi:SDR family oxidoreductase [Flavisphingomonas formosensis]|uniref:hypothetical protein n=1 Tax=Flavisphingomonas formosensis TaxID=861534 RepID=UPI0012FB8192|nr:hypothetical protein [Sphingomonas formosensis]
MNGKLALITGAGTADGAQLALRAAEAGYDLILADCDAMLYATLADCLHYGGEAIAIETDVPEPEQLDDALSSLGDRKLDLVCSIARHSSEIECDLSRGVACAAMFERIAKTPKTRSGAELMLMPAESLTEENAQAGELIDRAAARLSRDLPPNNYLAITTVHDGRVERFSRVHSEGALTLQCGRPDDRIAVLDLAWRSLAAGQAQRGGRPHH